MNATHLTDLTIENFRGFRQLELHGLQAVNLIVGQNNAGKTSLLEAILAAAAPRTMDKLPGMLRVSSIVPNQRDFQWLLTDGSRTARIIATFGDATEQVMLSADEISAPQVDNKPRKFSVGGLKAAHSAHAGKGRRVRVVSVHHQSPSDLVTHFADAIRPPEQQRLLETLLAKVDPRIRDIRLDVDDRKQPFIAIDLGLKERLPLPLAGQGIYRLVAIFADLLGERPDICLIDEIENGLHHTALKDVWRGLAEVSSMLGIQIFATTHSHECLEAAQRVFLTEDPENQKDFAVVQIMRMGKEIAGKVLDEARVEAALENEIELR